MRALHRDGVLLDGARDRQRRANCVAHHSRGGELGPARAGASMKRVAVLLPASFPDAIGPGEYRRGAEAVHVGCPECSVIQRLEGVQLSCVNPACPLVTWVELATDAGN
jgi:hypothetical protein